jgi:hypothetical protein
MNAPMTPPGPGPMPMAPTPPTQAYPGGAEVMADQNAQMGTEQVDNPVIAGFQSIMQLIGTLQQKGDPRAQPAAEALKNLLSILGQGAGGEPLPMSPPNPAPGAQGPMPGAPAPGAGPVPMPGPGPAGPGAPMPGPEAPMPEMAFNPFEAPAEAPKAPVKPMMRRQGPAGKQPTVLTA